MTLKTRHFLINLFNIVTNQLMINASFQREAPITEAVLKVVLHYVIMF